MCMFCLVLCFISSHPTCAVFYCFCPCPVISVDPLCRNFAVALQRRRILSHHYWPGREKIPETPPLLYFSCFLQALSAISQPVYQILAPKYSERWFDLKGRTTATMIISIGRNPSHKMESPQLTRARLSESSRWWVRPATVTHIFGYPQVGTCTFSYLPR